MAGVVFIGAAEASQPAVICWPHPDLTVGAPPGGRAVDSTALWLLIAAVLVLVGLAGIVLPALPGVALIFTGLVVAAWAESFQYVGAKTLAVLGVLTAFAWGLDLAAGAIGARRFGASRKAIAGAAIGAVVGLFFAIPGMLLGPFVGAVIGELLARRDLEQAGRAGIGAWLGLVLGVAAKLALSVSMIAIFLFARFWQAD
jgi:uncharacterized protein YqgC (DUF456 family)